MQSTEGKERAKENGGAGDAQGLTVDKLNTAGTIIG